MCPCSSTRSLTAALTGGPSPAKSAKPMNFHDLMSTTTSVNQLRGLVPQRFI